MATVRDILKALDVITGGRVITDSFGYGGANPFVVTKTSGIPGKAVTELPGLVWGDPDMPVKKVAVMMTLTESAIELAGATGIDCLIAHHPIAEGSNTGGVTASFASLGDIMLAEPGALIGFAGPRVIEQTIRQKAAGRLPSGRSSCWKGFVDDIVERPRQKEYLSHLLELHQPFVKHAGEEEQDGSL